MQDAYFTPWLAFAAKEQLLEIFGWTEKIRPFCFALNFSRVKQCSGMEHYHQYDGYLAQGLRDFIRRVEG